MTFNNEELVIEEEWINCPTKKVRVKISDLLTFFRTKKKMVVGYSYDPAITFTDPRKLCEAWFSTNYVHIGCLKETEVSFRSKYIELIKQLNSKQ